MKSSRDIRVLGRTRAFGTLAGQLARVPIWLTLKPQATRAKSQERAFFAAIAKGFGLHIDVRGSLCEAPGTLFVSNHISWADIPVLASRIDARFVAKDDIAAWPILGALARRYGPIFVDRGRSASSVAQADAIRGALASGQSVILFAEGTTSDGTTVLPFRTSLFAAADAATAVQPLAIRYLDRSGAALTADRQREVAWIGNDALLPGAARVARIRTRVLVQLLEPVAPGDLTDRKVLAALVRSRIASAYAAAPNLPR